jgi:hypothetical protein
MKSENDSLIMNNELVWIWKKEVMAYSAVRIDGLAPRLVQ